MLTKRQFADGPPIRADPNAKEHDEFKRRFRVPYQFFLTIIADISDSGREWFPRRHRRCNIPIQLKVLGVFRQLGRDTTCDDIAELAGISAETQRTFFQSFIRLFVEVLGPEYLSSPSDARVSENEGL